MATRILLTVGAVLWILAGYYSLGILVAMLIPFSCWEDYRTHRTPANPEDDDPGLREFGERYFQAHNTRKDR